MTDRPVEIRNAFSAAGWFADPGAYVLVDGAFGSTGKGALAALIAELFGHKVDVVTTNAGPNSGHTGYATFDADGLLPDAHTAMKMRGFVLDEQSTTYKRKFVTQQIPVLAAVTRALYPQHRQLAYLNGGAVINARILGQERIDFGFSKNNLVIHPNAAMINDLSASPFSTESLDKIASTGKGVGPAMAAKIMRMDYIARNWLQGFDATIAPLAWSWNTQQQVVFVETAQGFSLGINQPFYPYVTSRECTVMQALADAAIPASMLRKTIMTVRTFPIRVGNTDKGTSGGWYDDQQETTWEALGVEPEITTVTKRVRRVATWSRNQFTASLKANWPDALFINFMNYIKTHAERFDFVRQVLIDYENTLGRKPDFVLLGYGPLPVDVRLWEG